MIHNHKMHGLYILVSLGVVFYVISSIPPADFSFFSSAARSWLSGESKLYDDLAPQFFYAPWSLIILTPLISLPEWLGHTLLTYLSFLSLCWGTMVLGGKRSLSSFTLAIANPFTWSLIVTNQWDGFVVGGAALGWVGVTKKQPWILGLALLVLTTKPTTTIITVLLLVKFLRGWNWRALVHTAMLPVLAVLFSFYACGSDWIWRYINFIKLNRPLGLDVSIWNSTLAIPLLIVAVLVLIIWLACTNKKIKDPKQEIAFALTLGLTFAPFVVPYSISIQAPTFVHLSTYSKNLAYLAYTLGVAAFILFFVYRLSTPLSLYLVMFSIFGLRAMFASPTPQGVFSHH